jgi:hypothetical protein
MEIFQQEQLYWISLTNTPRRKSIIQSYQELIVYIFMFMNIGNVMESHKAKQNYIQYLLINTKYKNVSDIYSIVVPRYERDMDKRDAAILVADLMQDELEQFLSRIAKYTIN